ncbi:hypothetical protein EVAR_902_1 [Eumeta japonica]|uniref:Uncharacterized protein n=1 Tax=Eumeta variegata TaxID=151549 RepID=A0A4C1SDS3_EUMVA|nr:hypothetical protein EVAR_902_1 [Eumeta japonica]
MEEHSPRPPISGAHHHVQRWAFAHSEISSESVLNAGAERGPEFAGGTMRTPSGDSCITGASVGRSGNFVMATK